MGKSGILTAILKNGGLGDAKFKQREDSKKKVCFLVDDANSWRKLKAHG